MAWSALIADDEPPARKRVADLLRDEKDVLVAAQCTDGLEAAAAIRRHRPDFLFLDIQMPGLTGFDLLKDLPEDYEPAILFLTAFQEHAIRAFGADAIDYLLKPFSKDRFRRALDKARAFLQGRDALRENRPPGIQRLLVKSSQRIVLLSSEDIDWVEAAGNYLVLHAGTARHCIRGTMARMEQHLSPHRFARVSRAAIVNLERIKEFCATSNGQHAVVLRDGQRIPMTRSLSELKGLLGRVA